ncbi:MAG: CGNR zinc finger domain-containing protein [Thermomicrobiales bacterium]
MEAWPTLALDLINTFDPYFDEPESLRTPADLARFFVSREINVEGTLDDGDLRSARELRDHLRAVFAAVDTRAAAAVLNGLLDGVSVRPRVAPDDDGVWHTELSVNPDTPPMARLAIETTLGLAAALQRYGLDRLHICASPPCQEAFVDTSRNASRRFCSDRCANRYNVAAFRERQRAR